jgi:LacI family transcriptional regulator
MKAATDRGLRIPEDLAIAGFDNMDSSRITTPPLTTVSQPVQEIGQAAVGILLDKINNPCHDQIQEILPVELIERQSTNSTRS